MKILSIKREIWEDEVGDKIQARLYYRGQVVRESQEYQIAAFIGDGEDPEWTKQQFGEEADQMIVVEGLTGTRAFLRPLEAQEEKEMKDKAVVDVARWRCRLNRWEKYGKLRIYVQAGWLDGDKMVGRGGDFGFFDKEGFHEGKSGWLRHAQSEDPAGWARLEKTAQEML